jgi:hypothetical protein
MTNSNRKLEGRGKITLICPACTKEFQIFKAHYRGKTNACSKECSHKIKPTKGKTMIDHCCKECGKEFQTRKGNGGTGDYCSIPCMALARGRKMSGANHPKWNNGSSKRTHKSRRVIADLVKERGKCEECGATDNLQGHHIKSHSQHPVERTNPDNIQVLCVACHAGKHPKLAKFILSGQIHA